MPPWAWTRRRRASVMLLLALLLVGYASAFLLHHHHHPRHDVSRWARRRHQASTTMSSSAASQPRFLVLFKGGIAGNADEGTSLACLRESEFRGLARSVMMKPPPPSSGGGFQDPAAAIVFTDALETDLSIAAGRVPTDVNDGDEEDDDDDASEASGPSSLSLSSLMAVEGLEDAEALRRVVGRAVLVHAAYEVWAMGRTLEECAANANAELMEGDPRLRPWVEGASSWAAKCVVFGETFGRRKSLKDLPKKLELFRDLLLRLPGPVDLKRPQLQLALFEDGDAANGEPLHRVYLCRELGLGARGLTRKLSLKRRGYVTTTSMDPKASLVMSNVAGMAPGDRVLDPFAGSGGLLLAAAELGGGATVGVDVNASIDLSKVADNFREQGLAPPVAYLFGDSGTEEVQAQLRELGPFDVVVADPPYGKREKGAARAEGAVQEAVRTLVRLASAAGILRVGGRMTYFVPAHPSCPDIVPLLPSHPCLALLDAARQPLNANLDRWLVTVVKAREALAGEEELVLPAAAGTELGVGGDDAEDDDDEGALRIWHYRPAEPAPPSPSPRDGG